MFVCGAHSRFYLQLGFVGSVTMVEVKSGASGGGDWHCSGLTLLLCERQTKS